MIQERVLSDAVEPVPLQDSILCTRRTVFPRITTKCAQPSSALEMLTVTTSTLSFWVRWQVATTYWTTLFCVKLLSEKPVTFSIHAQI